MRWSRTSNVLDLARAWLWPARFEVLTARWILARDPPVCGATALDLRDLWKLARLASNERRFAKSWRVLRATTPAVAGPAPLDQGASLVIDGTASAAPDFSRVTPGDVEVAVVGSADNASCGAGDSASLVNNETALAEPNVIVPP
jgi:hypothetical protein